MDQCQVPLPVDGLSNFFLDSGIDTQYFSAHSTRDPASYKAAAAGVPVESIMQAAQWSRESTFSKHYRRDLSVPLNVQDAVFQSG